MSASELLTNFNGLLDQYAELRGYIDRAKAQEGKFSAATIERVILKNEIKSQEVGDEIRPLVPDIEAVLLELHTEIEGIRAKKASADEEMEELQLRQIIGELTDEEFDAASANFREQLGKAEARISELSAEQDEHQGALDRWLDMAAGAQHDTGVSDDEGGFEDDDSHEIIVDEPVVEDAIEVGEVYEQAGGLVEDLSDMFPVSDEPAQVAEPVVEVEEISIEVGGGDEDDAEIDVEVGFADDDAIMAADQEAFLDEEIEDEEDEEDSLLAGDEGEEEINLVSGGSDDDLGLEISDDEIPGDEPSGGAQRRALLIYQEGTAEEQIYPFTGDQITVGRGRDNDIQIKNDSKVSRYHCKVFRRGDNFYIEDNKSSNGSLVNGELVTERRLFGGEEIIIGETFFRFRIME
ncbi:MAG: FHA domain-containing protein [Alphaproteobacteria bacterium]|nr:FHA domain-containing protein [Alphaproteobacteria bacterium]